MDEMRDRQALLQEVEHLQAENTRLAKRMETMRHWNNSLLHRHWQESDDKLSLEVPEEWPDSPDSQELLQELRIHQEELRVQNEELLEVRRSLEQSQARYQALFRNSPLPCLVLDEACRITELNRQAAQLLHQANPDLHPERMPMSLFLHRYSQESFRRHIQRVVHEESAQRDEWKLRDEQIVVAHSFALDPNEDGRARGCQIVLENVTLQRQEELQKLQEREGRLLQAQQLARLGDWQWEEGQIFCSPHLYTLLQIHPSTAPPNFFNAYLERIPASEQEMVRGVWENALQRAQPFTLAHSFLLPNGQRLRLRVQGSPTLRSGVHRFLGFMQVIPTEEGPSLLWKRNCQLDHLLAGVFSPEQLRVPDPLPMIQADAYLLRQSLELLQQAELGWTQIEVTVTEKAEAGQGRVLLQLQRNEPFPVEWEKVLRESAESPSSDGPLWLYLLRLQSVPWRLRTEESPQGLELSFPLAVENPED